MVFVFIILWVGLCAIPGTMAKDKGMGFGVGFIIGLLLGPVIGCLLVAILPGSPQPKSSRYQRGGRAKGRAARSGLNRAAKSGLSPAAAKPAMRARR